MKLGLSLALIYHLAGVLAAPLQMLRPELRGSILIAPYFDRLGLSSTWGFFAADAGHASISLEWELLGNSRETIGRGRWPDGDSPFLPGESFSRKLNLTRFLAQSEDRVERVMLPYLCQGSRDVGVRFIRLWKLTETLPTLAEAALRTHHESAPKSRRRKLIFSARCETPRAAEGSGR